MTEKSRILIVGAEPGEAADLQASLENLRYEVVGVTASGEEVQGLRVNQLNLSGRDPEPTFYCLAKKIGCEIKIPLLHFLTPHETTHP